MLSIVTIFLAATLVASINNLIILKFTGVPSKKGFFYSILIASIIIASIYGASVSYKYRIAYNTLENTKPYTCNDIYTMLSTTKNTTLQVEKNNEKLELVRLKDTFEVRDVKDGTIELANRDSSVELDYKFDSKDTEKYDFKKYEQVEVDCLVSSVNDVVGTYKVKANIKSIKKSDKKQSTSRISNILSGHNVVTQDEDN